MSDPTDARKSAELLDFTPTTSAERIGVAQARAALATARALRELDTTVRQRLTAIERTAELTAEKWITWDEGRGLKAVQVNHIQSFAATGDKTLLFLDGTTIPVQIPLTFGTVAMMVGI